MTVAKLVLGLSGVGVVLWADQPEQQGVRWIGLACVVAAWLLRFVEKGQRTSPNQGPSM